MEKADSEGLFKDYPLFERIDLPEQEPVDYDKINRGILRFRGNTVYIPQRIVAPTVLVPEYEMLIEEEKLKKKSKSKFIKRITDTLLGWIYKTESHNERIPKDNYQK